MEHGKQQCKDRWQKSRIQLRTFHKITFQQFNNRTLHPTTWAIHTGNCLVGASHKMIFEPMNNGLHLFKIKKSPEVSEDFL